MAYVPVIDWDEDAKCYMSGNYKVNDKITVRFPTVREIMFDIGEKEYWQAVFMLTMTPSDVIAELDDDGLDWEQVPEFDLFIKNFIFMSEDMLRIFLPCLNKDNFQLVENENIQQINLYDPVNDILIDSNIYLYIVDYIRYVHGIKKNIIKAGNAYTHKGLIEDAHKHKKWASMKKAKADKSQMKAYVSFLMASLSYSRDEVLDMQMNFFLDIIKRVSAIETAKEMPFMAYSGMIDTTKKENKKLFDPMRDF